MTLEDMALIGHKKLVDKAPQMTASWNAARDRMKEGYKGVGFGPTRTRNYGLAIDKAVFRTDPNKWRTNWLRIMKE